MAKRLIPARFRFVDSAGAAMSGYKLFFYKRDTTTAKDTFTDEAATSANTNPIVLNTQGRPPSDVWGIGDYKMVLTDPTGDLVSPIDTFNPLMESADTDDVVDSVSAMLAIDASTFEDGVLVRVAGDTAQDGLFRYDPLLTGTNDGGIVIAGWVRQRAPLSDDFINPKWFGCEIDDATDDTTNFQNCVTYASANGKIISQPTGVMRINSTITTANNTGLYIRGSASGFRSSDTYSSAVIKFTGAGSDDALFDLGQQAHFNFEAVTFKSTDNASQWHCLTIDTLGAGNTNQSSAAGKSRIQNCSFATWGGCCLMLGGEVFADIVNNYFHQVAQAIAVNGEGELLFSQNNIEVLVNNGFTAGAGNGDAGIYFYGTNARVHNNTFNDSNDYRHFAYFEECKNISWRNNKLERPGLVAPTKDAILVHNTTTMQAFTCLDSQFVSSSTAGTFTGRHIRFTGSANFQYYAKVDDGCVFTYGPTTAIDTPHIDCTANKPRVCDFFNANFREDGEVPLAMFADGQAGTSQQLFNGLRGSGIRFITVQSQPFTISAGQTGAVADFYGTDAVFHYRNTLAQLLPVRMEVHTSASPGDTVDFYLSMDSAKADKVALGSAEFIDEVDFALRADYVDNPKASDNQQMQIKYDSGASASTVTQYVIRITYAVVEGEGTTNDGAFPIHIG